MDNEEEARDETSGLLVSMNLVNDEIVPLRKVSTLFEQTLPPLPEITDAPRQLMIQIPPK
jgi:hypothetical protein